MKSWKTVITVLILALFSNLSFAAKMKSFVTVRSEAVVQEVIDGDTVTVLRDGVKIHVRMLFIDTMEAKNNQKLNRDISDYAKKGIIVKKKDMLALGKLGKIYLSSIIKKGDKVILESYKGNLKDRYGRTLAVLYKNSSNINLMMVREGYARVYFIGRVPDNVKKTYTETENTAKSGKKVIWNYLN